MSEISFVPAFEQFVYYPHNASLEDELKRLFADLSIIKQPVQPSAEEIREDFRHNGRDFEYVPDKSSDDCLDDTVISPRRKKKKGPSECVFCRNNGKSPIEYKCHILKDTDGIIRCPILRAYKCPICGVSGDNSHTIKYCPLYSFYY
ncbi:nanos homolog 3-like [Aphidius gifuensis]|uniref:nanos homolog 3-like n=1 Tax=Aphidius gifuensis TaxID=684658 RepID=UPI001CDD535D|nr:nanos homolog 3-like [Aphidius gifuensis]